MLNHLTVSSVTEKGFRNSKTRLLFLEKLKAALDGQYFETRHSFWLNFIYQVNIDRSLTSTKRKIQNYLPNMPKVKKSSIWDEAICIHFTVKNMVILNQNAKIYIMLSYFLYLLFKELHKQASKFSSKV